MKNFVQIGEVLVVTAASDVASGDLVITGGLAGVAAVDIATGERGAVHLEGVYALPKANEALDQGDALYWDADGNPVGGTAGTGCLTATASGNTLVGCAFAGAASGAATVDCRLKG